MNNKELKLARYDAGKDTLKKKRELTAEEQELKRLRKELSDVIMERDILRKALVIFSKSGR